MSDERADSKPSRQSGYGIASCAMALITILIFLVTTTVFDTSLGNLSLATQRWIGFITLVLPAVVGAIFGLIGLLQREHKKAIAWLGLLLNTMIAAFFAAVLSFAG